MEDLEEGKVSGAKQVAEREYKEIDKNGKTRHYAHYSLWYCKGINKSTNLHPDYYGMMITGTPDTIGKGRTRSINLSRLHTLFTIFDMDPEKVKGTDTFKKKHLDILKEELFLQEL